MRETYCEVKMQFVDTEAKTDATYTASNQLSYTDVSLLSEVEQDDIALTTLELNNFILDGSKSFATSTDKLGWISEEESSEDLSYTNNSIVISFTKMHASSGLTLSFLDYIPSSIKITWLLGTAKLSTMTYDVTDNVQFYKNSVYNFNKIQIDILESTFPSSLVKLQYIMFGANLTWNKDNISEAKLSESIDVNSTTIEINTAKVSIIDVNNDFDLYDTEGDWRLIQRGQKINLYEYIDSTSIFLGSFYVDTFTSENNVVTFELQDGVGLLDKNIFYGGRFYSNENVYDLLDEIFIDSGFENYYLSEDLKDYSVNGYLAPITHREAIQQVCFAIGAIVDCSRSENINIYIPSKEIKHLILRERKFDETKIKLNDYYSDVVTDYSLYKQADEEEGNEIYNETLEVGNYTLYFSEPHHSYSISGGTIIEYYPNYIVVNVPSSGSVVVTAYSYENYTYSVSGEVDTIDAGNVKNTQEYSGMTVMGVGTTSNVCNNLLNSLKLRKEITISYLSENEKVGDWCRIEQKDYPGNYNITRIISQDIDLSGGFISTSKCTGYEEEKTSYYYSGEFYSGEIGGVI